MRKINNIVVHCTGGPATQTVSDIKAEFKRKGWKNPGYHYLIDKEGTITQLLDLSKVANGVKGHNSDSVHVAYIGGIGSLKNENDTRTGEQKKSLLQIIKKLHKDFPEAQIKGHRDFSPDQNHNGIIDPWERIKACPCFDAMEEYKGI